MVQTIIVLLVGIPAATYYASAAFATLYRAKQIRQLNGMGMMAIGKPTRRAALTAVFYGSTIKPSHSIK